MKSSFSCPGHSTIYTHFYDPTPNGTNKAVEDMENIGNVTIVSSNIVDNILLTDGAKHQLALRAINIPHNPQQLLAIRLNETVQKD